MRAICYVKQIIIQNNEHIATNEMGKVFFSLLEIYSAHQSLNLDSQYFNETLSTIDSAHVEMLQVDDAKR